MECLDQLSAQFIIVFDFSNYLLRVLTHYLEYRSDLLTWLRVAND